MTPGRRSPAGPTTYRIDWTGAGFVFFIDNVQVAEPDGRAHGADADRRERLRGRVRRGCSVDSATLRTRKPPGTFTSRALDAGDARVTAAKLTPTATHPARGSRIETRTADTAAGVASAAWRRSAPVAPSPKPKRFVQYVATFTTANAALTPRLDKVDVAFTTDADRPPSTIRP